MLDTELYLSWRYEQWTRNERTRFGFIVQIVEEKHEQRYCPKCKKEIIVDVVQLKMVISK